MARVTVEDCVKKVDTRFDLVLLAAHRARNIHSGADLLVDRDNDKNPVVALREIADEEIGIPTLQESLISSLQRILPQDEEEERLAIEQQQQEAEQQPETTELDMMRALTADRDGPNDSRF